MKSVLVMSPALFLLKWIVTDNPDRWRREPARGIDRRRANETHGQARVDNLGAEATTSATCWYSRRDTPAGIAVTMCSLNSSLAVAACQVGNTTS
jgi:hypothetical protein